MAAKLNHLAKMELNKKNMLDAGRICDRFPRVSGIVIHMTYYQRRPGSVFMERTVNFYPSGYAYFNMRCMAKGCENGGFDLSPVIKGLVGDGKRTGKGFLSCHGAEEGHASVSYRISISYFQGGRSAHNSARPGRRQAARQPVPR
ncbi:MAG: hypothetical protein M0Z58_10065 [Nitrospiraceae bacterium]|nr:hypothetical protein [Nitrospiraceae bacterium]